MANILWHRRRCLAALASGAALTVSMPNVARAETGSLAFSVWRKGEEIGSHDMKFTRAGKEFQVEIEIRLGVKLFFIPVFEYAHENEERWHGGLLSGFRSKTDENGELFEVDTVRQADKFVSRTLTDQVEHPPHSMPTTYWHRSFLRNSNWINTQDGSAAICNIASSDRRTIEFRGQPIEAERFRLTGDLELDLWYRGNDWVKLEFMGEDGSIIEYRLNELRPIDPGFA